MQDEEFARSLYADWESFFRVHVSDVADGFFSRYDSGENYLEIDRLDLDLGTIPQERFHELFPVRFREALERSFTYRLPDDGKAEEPPSGRSEGFLPSGHARRKRFENLLHCLAFGFCLPEWDETAFDMAEELRLFQDTESRERLLSMLSARPDALERLFSRIDADRWTELLPVAEWLNSATLGNYAKQRFLAILLERAPQAFFRFLHGTKGADDVEFLAVWLDKPHVRRLMAAEAEGHAETGLPEYWFALYGWLLEHYPFQGGDLSIGIPDFGDKEYFRQHLNRRFLSFIGRMERGTALSRSELAGQFLSEVFGEGKALTAFLQADPHAVFRDLRPEDRIDSYDGTSSGLSVQEETVGLSYDWLLSPSVSDSEKRRRLRFDARQNPAQLWELVRKSTAEDAIPLSSWSRWLDSEDWLEIVAWESISIAEVLHQTLDVLSRKYGVSGIRQSEALVRFLAAYPRERALHENFSTLVRDFVQRSGETFRREGSAIQREESAIQREGSASQRVGPVSLGEERPAIREEESSLPNAEILDIRMLETELGLDVETVKEGGFDRWEDSVEPEVIAVPNAGLCLLAIWLPRLFGMLGLLSEDRKDLKDTEARIRAVFLLQRLVTEEVREYKEQELAFNRLLTGCPFHVPLPKTYELTENEIHTVESMLVGVKANWDKLRNTSVNGFRRSFIERSGRLERRMDRWVLYVESRPFDLLLDSLPWSYSPIRLPWLKKKVTVLWRDKEDIDF